MKLRRFRSPRIFFSLSVVAAVAGVLAMQRSGPEPNPEGVGVIYVYFPSLCAAPGDARDCHEMRQPVRPSFESMAACSAFADVELRREHDPRVMASCMKEREA
jgi:hypothetical protein